METTKNTTTTKSSWEQFNGFTHAHLVHFVGNGSTNTYRWLHTTESDPTKIVEMFFDKDKNNKFYKDFIIMSTKTKHDYLYEFNIELDSLLNL